MLSCMRDRPRKWRLTWTAALGEDRQGTCDCPLSTIALPCYFHPSSSNYFNCLNLKWQINSYYTRLLSLYSLGAFFNSAISGTAFSESTALPVMTPVAAAASSALTGGPVKCLRAYAKYQMMLMLANPANTTLA